MKTPEDDGRLPGPDGTPGTGLAVEVAVAGAEAWWDKTGRQAAIAKFNEEEIGRRVKADGKGPSLVVKGTMAPVVPSGILRGVRWRFLRKSEKISVLKAWYSEVWAPSQRGDKPKPIDPAAHAGGSSTKVPE